MDGYVGPPSKNWRPKQRSRCWVRIGAKSELNEYRSNCFAKGGVDAGIVEGKLVLGREQGNAVIDVSEDTVLRLAGQDKNGNVQLTLTAETVSGQQLDRLIATVPANAVLGNVSLVSNFDPQLKQGQGGQYRFNDWSVSGNAFTIDESKAFGPILWSMYSLSDSRSDEGFVLKISALTGPLGQHDNKTVELQVDQGGNWKSLGHAKLDTDAWTATFRISNWNEKVATPYRLLYRELKRGGTRKKPSGAERSSPIQREDHSESVP